VLFFGTQIESGIFDEIGDDAIWTYWFWIIDHRTRI
jgi:hypothetical protein